MDITDRLVLFMQHEGVTTFQMNKAAGLSRTLLAKAIDNHQGLSSSTIEKISHTYPNLNIDWLITGRGEMLMTDEPKKNLNKKAQYFRKISKAASIVRLCGTFSCRTLTKKHTRV